MDQSVRFFVIGSLLSLSLCMDLGLVNVAIIRSALSGGFLPAFLIGLGSSLGDLFYAFISLLGINAISHYVVVRWSLWLGGTFVLLFLSYKMFKESFAANKFKPEQASSGGLPQSNLKNLCSGFVLAISSPSAILWYATVGGNIMLSIKTESPDRIVLFLGGFFLTGVLFSTALSLTTCFGSKVLGPNLVRGLSIISGALFFYLALQTFFTGYQTLIIQTK